ncbi:MAG: cytochrome c biogenesis protein CcsA [Lautropia sp.]|nr:cytochrome c biogenesis protein CcsA [Lautropia sp.]
MSIVLTLVLLSVGLYALALVRGLRRDARQGGGHAAAPAPVSAAPADGAVSVRPDPVLGAALVTHALTLLWPMSDDVFHFGFAYLLSATVWIGLFLVWVESRRVTMGRLPLLLAPLAMLLVTLPQFFPGAAFRLDQQAPLFVPHLVVGTLAYGMVFMAALQALLMAAAEHRLHPRRQDRAGVLTTLLARGHQALPPLMVLERILFQVIRVAFVLLLLTTVSGAVFGEEIFGRALPLNHKTVFSLVATVFFGLLLLGRRLWGWRGRLAIRLTLGGFILLLLSYVGSRFVLEVILQRI